MKHLLPTTIAAVLLLGCQPSRVDQEMSASVRAGDIETVREYLDFGGNVNVKNELGNTPLHWAVNEDYRGSHKEMVELLIANGADVNAVDDLQATPLHMANNKETAIILINEGANINAKDYQGRTLLHDAAKNAANASSKTRGMHLNLVELLIENDAELSTKNKSGNTPLHLVASGLEELKGSEICELLLTNGATVNAVNNAGHTPLDVAIHKLLPKTVDVLRKYGGKTAEELKADGK
ncbi:MAG: ankyrin repeat domain-containing protein [Pirellulales bacterium]|jgi:ankyrin repeat protein